MKIEECIKRIDRYLRSNDTQPRFVNVQNIDDFGKLKQHFRVGTNQFKQVEDFCKSDENLSVDALLNDLYHQKGVVFLTGFTTHFMLLGEVELAKQLSKLMNLTTTSYRLVVLCYQCERYLVTSDIRFQRIVYLVEGEKYKLPKLVFFSPSMPPQVKKVAIDGIHRVANSIEIKSDSVLYIKTSKNKSSYPYSLYHISDQKEAFKMLCDWDVLTEELNVDYGTKEQWSYILREVSKHPSWASYFTQIFGGYSNLELVASNWCMFEDKKKWVYFISLKLFGAKNNWCLNTAVQEADSMDGLISCIFRSLLSVEWNDRGFWDKYYERKALLDSFGNPDAEVIDYCCMVKMKEKYTLYYLTDNTSIERTLIFQELDAYALELGQKDVIEVLGRIYPDLYAYLQPFRFENDLLNTYFQAYKYQKVINKIFPEFEAIVEEQAEKREYNLILPARAEKIEAIDKEDTHLYFMDAMGVEYLGFVMEKCRQKGLLADVTVCRCELPSITCFNKEFVEVFEKAGAMLVPDKNGIKALDNIKHHGQNDYDYRLTQLPSHLIAELEIIDDVLGQIKIKLAKGECSRAVMISDHGASRLSVISNKENKWEMATKGKHSGRCCPKNEINECPTCATEENDFWVLANYDRFKGSRKANVEVHGGATLEEVAVPIIEITYSSKEIEIEILTPFIEFSTMKKNAAIKLFSKTKLRNVSVSVEGKDYDVETMDGQTFLVNMPDLKKIGEYTVDMYAGNNKVASGLTFNAKKEGFKENKLL